MAFLSLVVGVGFFGLWVWLKINPEPKGDPPTPFLMFAAFFGLMGAASIRNIDWPKTIALGTALLLFGGTVAVVFRKRHAIREAFRSGWVRLFFVVWPLFAAWRWSAIDDSLEHWNDPLNGAPDQVFLQCVLAPPVLALAARWVVAGFRNPA